MTCIPVRPRLRLQRSLLAALVLGTAASAALADKIRIAYIDPLSGPFAETGINVLRSWQLVAEIANRENWAPGHTFEVTGFDNKANPQESLAMLKSASDNGYRYIAQGFGSGSALALVDALNKHNQRNPGKEMVYFNTSAGDPDLTGAKCSFWHFSLDSNADVKMNAMAEMIAANKAIKRVYLLNPNYALGQQVSRAAKEQLPAKRADIEIVGDDLHPFGQVKDFAPYIAKAAAAKPDIVITASAGSDLALLIKAARDYNLAPPLYTYYAVAPGMAVPMGAGSAEKVRAMPYWHANEGNPTSDAVVEAFKAKFNDDYFVSTTYTGLRLLAQGIVKSGSTDPTKVAFAMEDMPVDSLNGRVTLRKADHQVLQPLFAVTWAKAGGAGMRYDLGKTGHGWRTDERLSAEKVTLPTTCAMQRPNPS